MSKQASSHLSACLFESLNAEWDAACSVALSSCDILAI
jgi:hypothetical protein